MRKEPVKIKVYYFHNGSGGGVLSVIKNLVTFSDDQLFEKHIIYTISTTKTRNYVPPQIDNIASQQVFYYSPNWNFYHTCKQLSRLISDAKAVIVANDWLELGMVAHIGLNNPVIQILHGDYDYYYQLSVKQQGWIDGFITVAEVMAENLRQEIPARVKDIYYLPFPVPAVLSKDFFNVHDPLQIIFVGRLSKDKGYDVLPLIEQHLRNKNIGIRWLIIGNESEVERSVWPPFADVQFYGSLPNEKVIDIMRNADCFILPSLAEGMPVTLAEAMKVGLTCLVNDLRGGIQELIKDGVTGYKVDKNEPSSYAAILEQLHRDRSYLQQIGQYARATANAHFEPVTNTSRYEQLFQKYSGLSRRSRMAGSVYGSRLDKRWIPNFITSFIRRF